MKTKCITVRHGEQMHTIYNLNSTSTKSKNKKKRLIKESVVLLLLFLLSGCGKNQNSVVVQAVSDLCEIDMQEQFYAGTVTTGNEAKIKRDSDKKVSEIKVKVGDIVKKDAVLFSYDAEQYQNSLEKAELELEKQKNELETQKEELESLEKSKEKVRQEDELEYTIKIQSVKTEIRESEYEINIKEKNIKTLKANASNLDVKAPFEGRVESIAKIEDENTSANADDTFIKIVETDNYRVLGTIDETNINNLSVGMEMVIHSRTDDKTWEGTIEKIDYKTPNKNESDSSEESESSESASKYPFYIHIDDLNGLMIGQHVYMTPKKEQAEEIILPSDFLYEKEYVWTDENGVLKKRKVKASYNEENDTYTITDGITDEDLIAVAKDYEEGTTTRFIAPKDKNKSGSSEQDVSSDLLTDEDYNDAEFSEEFSGEEYDAGSEFDVEDFDAEDFEDE